MAATYDFHNRYDRYHYDIKPENFMITNINAFCWFAKMIDIDGSVNAEEIKTQNFPYTTRYSHHFFEKYIRNKTPFLNQDLHALGATLFDIIKAGMGYDLEHKHGCGTDFGANGCIIRKLIPKIRDIKHPISSDSKSGKEKNLVNKLWDSLLDNRTEKFMEKFTPVQFECMLNTITSLIDGKEKLEDLIDNFKTAFPEIERCRNPPV